MLVPAECYYILYRKANYAQDVVTHFEIRKKAKENAVADEETLDGRSTHQTVGLFLGPLLTVLMLWTDAPAGLSEAGWRTAAIGMLMAVWWATEAVPIAVAALVPLVCFPLLGIASIHETAAPYANKVIYLFLGGFIVAYAMQRWNLHKRIALNVLQVAGGNGRSLVGGFMLASAVISMWVMNTSTTMMMLPIAVSIITVIQRSVRGLDQRAKSDFQHALLLGVAYGATIGGLATLIGTLPNAMFAAFMLESYGTQINFANWIMVGLPMTIVLLPLTWIVLTRGVFKVNFETSTESRLELKRMKEQLGKITTPEIRVAIVFATMAICWVSRPLLVKFPGLSALDDSGIAMAGAIALFLIPSGDRRDPLLLRWKYAEQMPWSVLILFGGGLTLASAVSRTGLAEWLGYNLQTIATLPIPVVVVIAAAMIIFLTELTSNTATTATFLPVVGAIALESGVDPIVLTVPVTLAASCAFMLPVATPPNAIVFGSGLLSIPKMARAGLVLNLIGVVVVTLAALFLAPKFL